MRQTRFDAVVVGGGFFGSRIALLLARKGLRVLLLEKESDLMTRASFANQARVHNGYHYPRSVGTARSSHLNYGRFADEFAECLLAGSASYYAIAKQGSKVTPAHFMEFCARIGAPLSDPPASVQRLFDPELVEVVFKVTEATLNAELLRNRLLRQLQEGGVETRFDTAAVRVVQTEEGRVAIATRSGGESHVIDASFVLNCTYSETNKLVTRSGGAAVPLKHELAEIALIEVPPALRNMAVTLIDGPFFSATPFPSRGLHALTHVRYTPHFEWYEGNDDGHRFDISPRRPPSNAERMQRDAQKFLPIIGKARIVSSLWEIKTVLPRSEGNDSRPILFKRSAEVPGLLSVLGAKIDCIYDIEAELEDALATGSLRLQ